MFRSYRIAFVLGFLTLFGLGFIYGQVPAVRKAGTSKSAQDAEKPAAAGTARYQSLGRRDPFLDPLLIEKKVEVDEVLSLGQPPPGIAGTYIAQASLAGISSSPDRDTAVMRGADKRVYFLREGDRLFDGYLKQIDVDSVTLVQETKFRSGKSQTQQVVKRLRTP